VETATVRLCSPSITSLEERTFLSFYLPELSTVVRRASRKIVQVNSTIAPSTCAQPDDAIRCRDPARHGEWKPHEYPIMACFRELRT
jgi:hypothetical protein